MNDDTKRTLTLKTSFGKDTASGNFPSRNKSVTVEVKRRRIVRPFGTAQSPLVGVESGNIDSETLNKLELIKNAEIERKKVEDSKIIANQQDDEQPKKEVEEAGVDISENSDLAKGAEAAESEVKTSEDEHKKIIEKPKEEVVAVELLTTTKKPLNNNNVKTDKFRPVNKDETEEEDVKKGFAKKLGIKNVAGKAKYDEPKKPSKVLIQNIDLEDEQRVRSLSSIKRAREKAKRLMSEENKPAEKIIREVTLPEFITVADLASRMSERGNDVIKSFMKMGMMVNLNQTIDADTAEIIIHEFGHKVKRVSEADVESVIQDFTDDSTNLETRPPVVTVMGHVDHGKTTLLDSIRLTSVVDKEAGGITQHIGAYQVRLADGQLITFIDTPGHEAFTEMRARGAKVTDVVVLVVAADDGIMPQTVEAISHAKAANVPIIVAINKIDKPDADINRVTAELLSHELVPESMGGDVIVVPVSAKQRTNLDKLLESVILQSEVLDLKANPNRRAKGIVVESRLEKGKGSVSTLLVQNGTLSLGDIIVTSSSFGKIKYMNNDQGEKISKALPSMPVEVLGLNEAPLAGEVFDVVSSEKEAKDVYEYRQRKLKEERSAKVNKTTLEDLFAKSSGSSRVKELNIIIKGDVQGSIEAIAGSLEKLISDEVKIRILHKAVGGITESDVTLANASNALILGFNVRANSQAKTSSEKCSIDIRYYSIIYDLIDDVKRIMSGMLQPIMREKYIGMLEIRKVFNVTKFGKIAGCYVTDGVVKRGAKVRLLRDNIVIHEGALKTLRRFKDDVKEVKSGYECGAAFENYEDIKEGDKVEASEIIEEKRAL